MKIKNKKGFALTEVLLAIAVVIIVGVGSYGLFSTSRNNADIEGFLNVMAELQKSSDVLLTATKPKAGDNFGSDLQTLGIWPEELDATTETYKGKFSVYPFYYPESGNTGNFGVGTVGGAGMVYDVRVLTKSASDCTKIATGLLNRFDNVGISVSSVKKNGQLVNGLTNVVQLCNQASGLSASPLVIVVSNQTFTSS